MTTTNDQSLLKIVFDTKNEFADYRGKTDKRIRDLDSIIIDKDNMLNEKINEIKVLERCISDLKREHTKAINTVQKDIVLLRKDNLELRRIIRSKDEEIKCLRRNNNN